MKSVLSPLARQPRPLPTGLGPPLRGFSITLTHIHGMTPLDERSARRREPYVTKHTTDTTEKHLCPRRDSNPQSQQANCRRRTS